MKYLSALALVSCAAIVPSLASAQQFNKPYSFTQQNRAQMAIAMKQIEDGGAAASGVSGGAGTTIVCGGGAATATANNTCIIMNNSTGTVLTDQISDGDQSASNSEEVTVNGENITDADEVLSVLAQ